MLKETENIFPSNYSLKFNNETLTDDTKTIEELGITNDSVLTLRFKKMKITIHLV
jgi:hypothetical protein